MNVSAYRPITLDQREEWQAFWDKTPLHTADYTFTNLWGWADHYGLEWRMGENLCWIRQTRHGDLPVCRLWAPLGDWNAVNWAQEPEISAGNTLCRVPLQLIELLRQSLPGRLVEEETQGQWEYLYTSASLSTLAGNKLHKKKNHVNSFIKNYGQDYRPLDASTMDDVLELQEDWCKWRECEKSPALMAENAVTVKILRHWESLPGLVGGALYVDNQMVAFSVGEALDSQTLVVHFEKGRADFRGVYQAINYFFSKSAGSGFTLINREQDADEDGLRQAKYSYFPCDFLKKNRIKILGKN